MAASFVDVSLLHHDNYCTIVSFLFIYHGIDFVSICNEQGSGGYSRSNFQVASSPPFFSGSPPSRASNPVIQDEQFGNSNFNPLSPAIEASPPPPSSARKSSGCVRVSFGHKPATVRVEGFNCRGNCSISAFA
ncbi:uncharacterized protein LOC111391237 [Olea europaea var. sylvestris]|uniref:uncharacterized protein LOC111391237 n=1 Tax=Olea europaea var. sylvestris TaxID=158386 RepID=UPI000C1CDA4B|nr:uncharacterized protein LOC111391237 [Olea europaea var. sylvestris]